MKTKTVTYTCRDLSREIEITMPADHVPFWHESTCGSITVTMMKPAMARKLANHILRSVGAKAPAKSKAEQTETIFEDGDVFYPPCPHCGSRSTDCGCD